ncbi:glycosyltransferase family 2 protein [Anaerorhabdus sp.]|uniref:glycosyltransferase family 2 protein n=1 Tax=Anaerorhabdus sp. TaxID=1872524 RepID=UPI002FC5C348
MISVIVPIYNIQEYIYDTLDSLIKQTYSDIEVLMIDDGSSDNSSEICKIFSKNDKRFIYYHKDNGGLSSARNLGLEKARGDFIFFLDGDDTIHPHLLEIMINKIGDSDIAYCNVEVVTNTLKTYLMNDDLRNNVATSIVTNIQMINRMYQANPLPYIVIWNKLYRYNIFNNISFPLNKLHEDEFVNYLIYDRAIEIKFIDFAGYYYLVRDNSITQSKMNIRRFDSLEALVLRQHYFEEKGYNELCKKNIDLIIYNFKERCKFAINFSRNERLEVKKKRKLIMGIVFESKRSTIKQKIKCILVVNYFKIFKGF